MLVGIVGFGQTGQGGGWVGAVPGDAEDGGEGFDTDIISLGGAGVIASCANMDIKYCGIRC